MKTLIALLLTSAVAFGQTVSPAARNGSNITNPAFRNAVLSGSNVDGTELGYLDGVSSGIQAQFNALSASEDLTAAVLVHDNCMGVAQSLTVNTERTVEPGPGIAELIRATTAPLCRYENGEMMLGGSPASALLNPVNLVRYSPTANTPITAAAGLTMIARVAYHGGYGIEHNLHVGFTDADNIKVRWGAININSTASTHPTLYISRILDAADETTYLSQYLDIAHGEEIALAVHYKSLTHIQYFIQARFAENLGCGVGGPNWFPIGESKPTTQFDYATVTAASGATSNGNLTVTVTASNLTGSPKAYSVPLTTATHTNSYKIAEAIATALNADGALTANWTATPDQINGGSVVRLERNAAADNISNLNVAIASGLGVSAAANSTHARQGSNPNMAGATVYGYISTQFDSFARVRDVRILSSWNPSPRAKLFDYDRGRIGIHIPSLAKDPGTGLVVSAWSHGINHLGSDHVFKTSVKLANGTWTEPQTILNAPTDATDLQMSSLSVINGQLYLVYAKGWTSGSFAIEGGPPFWRALTVNSTTGVITVGAEVALTVPDSTYNLCNSPLLQLPSGRILMFCDNEQTLRTKVAYSDNNGTSWTSVAIDNTNNSGEPCGVIESDGAIGCWYRSVGGRSVLYSRSADNGATWSTPVFVKAIPCPGGSGTRVRVRKMANGKSYLIGNDHYSDRRNVTMWEVGDNGAVYGKIPLLDGDPQSASTTAVLQYPDFIEDDKDLVISLSVQISGGGNLSNYIRNHVIRWPDAPVAREAGGTGKRTDRTVAGRRQSPPPGVFLAYGTAPVPDLAKGNTHYITLTASTAVIGVPLNPMPWEELTLVFQQGGAGLFTATFNSIFVFNGTVPTWQTAAGSTNILRSTYNPITNKWVVLGWN